MAVRVQQEDFDVGIESRTLQGPAVGAIALFVGTVRSLSGDDSVTAMTLEHYPGMTENEISRIEDEARNRWPLLEVRVVHRVVRLLAGEQIVMVAVSSAHRQAAFDAAQYIMDFLKTDAPFWKAEERGDQVNWVKARQSDSDARAKWTLK